MSENVTTIVQKGETLGLYAKLYGCTTEELTKLNKGKIGKNGAISQGEVLVIPIGKKPAAAKKEGRSILQEKINWFNDQLEEAKLKIYNPKLSSAEREKYEKDYIYLLNLKQAREKFAGLSISKDKMHVNIDIKEDITVAEFRKLYPEVGKNFRDYADKTKQYSYESGKGYVRDPQKIVLRKGAHFTLKTQEYAHQGFWTELGTSIKKTLGLGEF